MKNYSYCTALLIICIGFALGTNESQGAWYLGNLHSHSVRSSDVSGGTAQTPAQMTQIYYNGGFDFLCVSDHDTGSTDGAVTITDSFSHSVMSGSEYLFLGVTGSEVSRHRPHIGAPGMSEIIPGNISNTMQRMQEIYDRGGTPILNHPRWSNNMGTNNVETAEAIYRLGNFRMMEVWNTNTISRNQNPLSGHGDVDSWDLALNKDMYIIGIGTDDAHFKTASPGIAMTGAVMVRAATLCWENINVGMLTGDCYTVARPNTSTAWCTFDDQLISSTGIYVDSPNAVVLNFIVYDMLGNKLAMPALIDGATDSNPSDGLSGDVRAGAGIAAFYEFTGNERFVRAVASSDAGSHALSQASFRLSVPARELVTNSCPVFDTTNEQSEFALSWYRSEDPIALQQIVQRSDTPPYSEFIALATLPMSATQYTDIQVINGSTYAYRITTQLSDGRADQISDSLVISIGGVLNSNAFTLDFSNNGDICLFNILDDPGALTSAPSSWNISGGALNQDSNIYNSDAGDNFLGTYAVLSLQDKNNYFCEFDMTSGDNDSIGCVWRVGGQRNFYQLQWDAQRNILRVVRYTGSITPTVIVDKSSPHAEFVVYTAGITYHVQILAVDDQHTVAISGGNLVSDISFDFTDSLRPDGPPGFYTWGNTPSSFSNLYFQVVDSTHPTPTPTMTPTPTATPTATPTPPPSGTVLFDFSDAGQLDAFTIYDDWGAVSNGNGAGEPSAWQVALPAEELWEPSNMYSPPASYDSGDVAYSEAGWLGSYAVLNISTEPDYTMEFDLRATDDDALGCIWRWNGLRRFYQLCWDMQNDVLRVTRYDGDRVPVVLADKSGPASPAGYAKNGFGGYTQGLTYHIFIQIDGANFTITLNGGDIVTPIVFSITDATYASGQPGLYQEGSTDLAFDNVVFTELNVPPNSTPTYTPIPTPTPLNMILLDFSKPEHLSFFTTFDDPGANEDFPSEWNVTGHLLREDSNIFNSGTDAPLGTGAVLNMFYHDYVMEFDITPGDNDSIGWLWRYNNNRSFYAVRWDQQRAVFQVLSFNGTVTPQVLASLSSTAPTFVIGNRYHVRLQAQGNDFQFTVSGEGLASDFHYAFSDAGHPTGPPGLWNWGNDFTSFDNLYFAELTALSTPTPTATATPTSMPTSTSTPTPTMTGSYTATPTPTVSADFNLDGIVDELDLLILLQHWHENETSFN
jgi:hypothetical protein